ncbi:interleukin-1 receptor-associated kinase 4 isoform X3 [Crotalus tigris]|uniref:interleukin-1 receptor-associated kinase 4 isoform X3 n=1 Tax=Crotalus tigris TaxID=88082 RepID=UPI00192F84A5|nr:interleukin-1 receptor-associated kinase 4 isoform X3 [Crotalus tigris]
MTNSITPSTYVRSLGYGMMKQLADFIDPQEGWKKLAADITDSSGAKQYNQMQIRRFEALKQVGKSPTCELLYDWGTLNCTVSDLVDLLIRNQFLAPASLLIPDSVSMTKNMTLCLSLPETVLLHKKGPLVEGKKISELPSLDPNEGHLTSNSCDPSSENISSHLNDTGLKSFLFYELKSITNNFADQTLSAGGNKIGEGGFGVVYKGCINGQTVAVKKLTADNTSPIPWETRCNIAYGTSNGISFLHENNHIHRDVKSANILLTETFVPKLSDFGLARTSVRFTHTILTDRIVGTAAYMAPEALRGEITPKSDIFSFGVVLLEIITGLSPMDENRDPQLLLSIKEEIEDEEKTIGHYVDKKISNRNITSIEQMYSIASQCLHEKKNRRPDIERVSILNIVMLYICNSKVHTYIQWWDSNT